jgi:UDPglucose 6-dehydrogenase
MIVSEAIPDRLESPFERFQVLTVGAGVVGHAEGTALQELGHRVAFSDIDEAVLSERRAQGLRAVPMNGIDLSDVDVVLVSVSTPTADGRVDLRPLEAAVATIGEALGRAWSSEPGRYRVVIIRSTVPPGTTEDVVIPLLETNARLQAGVDFGVCTSPEYLRQRLAVSDAAAPRVVIIGQLDDRSGEFAERLNAGFGSPIYRVSLREAEFHKYAHNLCNASKIAFFNELRRVAAAIGVDPDRVFALMAQSSEAVWNAEYGTLDLGPFGGACLPKDLEAFLAWAERGGLELPIVSAVKQSNDPVQVR